MAIFAFVLGALCGSVVVLFSWLFFDFGFWWAVLLFYVVTYAVGFFPLLRDPVFPERQFRNRFSGQTKLKHAQLS